MSTAQFAHWLRLRKHPCFWHPPTSYCFTSQSLHLKGIIKAYFLASKIPHWKPKKFYHIKPQTSPVSHWCVGTSSCGAGFCCVSWAACAGVPCLDLAQGSGEWNLSHQWVFIIMCQSFTLLLRKHLKPGGNTHWRQKSLERSTFNVISQLVLRLA